MEEQKLINSSQITSKSSIQAAKNNSTTTSTNKIHPNEEKDALTAKQPEDVSLAKEIDIFIKESRKEKVDRPELLRRLKAKARSLTEDRIFKEVSSTDQIQIPYHILLSKDNNSIVAILENNSFGIFRRDPLTGLFYQKYQVKGASRSTWRFTFNHDESKIILASTEGKIYILSKKNKTGRFSVDKTIQAHPEKVADVCISFDDQLIISGGKDGIVKIWKWDAKSGQYNLHQAVEGHKKVITCLKISQDKKSENSSWIKPSKLMRV